MAHGNKKYHFETLKRKGDEIEVLTSNVYSTNQYLKKYCKENGIDCNKFHVSQTDMGKATITRIG